MGFDVLAAGPSETLAADESARDRRRGIGGADDEERAADFAGALASALSGMPMPEAAARPGAGPAGGAGDGSGRVDMETATARVLEADRSLDRLAPAFRRRVERVIERMRSEYGHDVRLVEGYRTQERQHHLYAQGRTRPGAIVTWTRNSLHTRGLAADLLVDGSYDNPVGYARLAEVAREEGLATLGPHDAGHVELPVAGRGAPYAAGPDGGRLATSRARIDAALDIATSGGAARGAAASAGGAGASPVVAPPSGAAPSAAAAAVAVPAVAAPARVQAPRPAAVAQVASVARPAAVGAGGAGRAAGHASGDPGAAGSRTGELATRSSSASSGAPRRAGRRPDEPVLAAPDVSASSHGTVAPAALERSAAPGAAGAAERVAGVLELQDAAMARPTSSVLLRLDDVDGGAARIRVALRGDALSAEISVPDPVEAARLGRHIDELGQALRRQSLSPESLRVHVAGERGSASADALGALSSAAIADPSPTGSPGAHTDPEAGRERGPDDEHAATHDSPRRDPNTNRDPSGRGRNREETR